MIHCGCQEYGSCTSVFFSLIFIAIIQLSLPVLFLVLFLSLATFPVNVPVIFVTLRSRQFENDPVAKLVASLAVSDIVNGIITNLAAVMYQVYTDPKVQVQVQVQVPKLYRS